MATKLLDRQGNWRDAHYIRLEIYGAWQEFERAYDSHKSAFLEQELGEPSKYMERLRRYQDRVCEGDVECHAKVAKAYHAWEKTDYHLQYRRLELKKDDLLETVDDGSYGDGKPGDMVVIIEGIANALPYVKKGKCKK